MKAKIAIIIPNFNGIDVLPACLKSVEEQTMPLIAVVVDNGSIDNSIHYVSENHPSVKIIELGVNRGFSGGVNAGIKYAIDNGYEYIGLLNNDAVANKDWAQHLLSVMTNDESVGIVASKMLREDGQTIDSTGEEYSIWGTPFPRGMGVIDTGQFDNPKFRNVLAASGGASLYRASMLNKIGYFDEVFFAYYEDVELSIRARRAKWKILYEPGAIVAHRANYTSNKMPKGFANYHKLKNYILLYMLSMPGRLFWLYLPTFTLGLAARTFALIKSGQPIAVAKAYVFILLYIPNIVIKRLLLLELYSKSTKEIKNLLYKYPSPSQSKHWPFKLFTNRKGLQ